MVDLFNNHVQVCSATSRTRSLDFNFWESFKWRVVPENLLYMLW